MGQPYPLPLHPSMYAFNAQRAALEAMKASPSFGHHSPFFPSAATLSPHYGDLCNAVALQQRMAAAVAASSHLSPMFQSMSTASNLAINTSNNNNHIKGEDTGPSSPANADLSPIHSPGTGAPIAVTNRLKREKPASHSGFNPLAQIASQFQLPNVTNSMNIAHVANAMAAQAQARERHEKDMMKKHLQAQNGQKPRPAKMPKQMHHQQIAMMSGEEEERQREQKRLDIQNHIKKPLNAFMIFMKENRQKLMEEKGYKERQSAELNKELGRLWHTLSQEDQQKYYAMAREERARHLAQYPGWSARDNYAIHKKNKKGMGLTANGGGIVKRRERKVPSVLTSSADSGEMKKCRARFGLDAQAQWCKHCKRKKRCLWFREGPGSSSTGGDHPSGDEQSPPAQVTSTTHGSSPDPHTSALLLKSAAAVNQHHFNIAALAQSDYQPSSVGGSASSALSAVYAAQQQQMNTFMQIIHNQQQQLLSSQSQSTTTTATPADSFIDAHLARHLNSVPSLSSSAKIDSTAESDDEDAVVSDDDDDDDNLQNASSIPSPRRTNTILGGASSDSGESSSNRRTPAMASVSTPMDLSQSTPTILQAVI